MRKPHATEKKPDWLEISFQIDPVTHDALSHFLFETGCEGIAVEDEEAGHLRAFMPPGTDLENLQILTRRFLERIKNIFDLDDLPGFAIKGIADENWGLAWRRFFKKERVTPSLTIIPAWERSAYSSGTAHAIRMDPGLAFGTGKHPTTRMCLKAMEMVPDLAGRSLLDVGTGSGILSIYGAKLGANRILAIDTDEEALRWARRNIALNGLGEAIELSSRPLSRLNGSFWLITANLILETILELGPLFPPFLEPGGYLAVSGILLEQVERFRKPFMAHGFAEYAVLRQEEWACILYTKTADQGKS